MKNGQRRKKGVTERRLVDVLVSFFRKVGTAAREVPYYEKRIDIMLLDEGSEEVWAIEAKTTAWSRALSQAIVNLSAADRSYIAILSDHVHRVPVDVLERHGIGLISVGTKWGDVTVVMPAEPSRYRNMAVIGRMRDRLLPQRGS